MPEALKLDAVRAGYGATVVLEDIGFVLEERQALAVLGRNGVGKTTMLATIMGLTTFHAGSIEFRGRKIEKLQVHERARLGIGYVPQTRDVFPSLSIEENLAVAARPGRWSLERVYEMFPQLRQRHKQRAGTLSGGEQQMLVIGRALMGNPDVLLLDEPSEGLAPMIVHEVAASIAKLKAENLSIILVEQNFNLAMNLADDIVVLNTGHVVAADSVEAVRANPENVTRHLGVF